MELPILPGSTFLQACFYGLAAAILIAAGVLRRKAASAAGDSRTAAARIQRRFHVAVGRILLARSSIGDRLARGLPLAYLVGFQAFRFPLELAIHRAYVEGVMPVQMSYSGRNFDIVTGLTALVLAAALAMARVPRWLVLHGTGSA